METGQCSMVQALHDKYSCDEPLDFNIFVPKSAPGKTETGELVLPRHLTLNACAVDCGGDRDQLTKLCSKVCELDIADNRLSSWEQVLAIMECLPLVTFVNLSGNRLKESEDSLDTAKPLPNIVTLILNNTGISWVTIRRLVKLTPNLRALHLSLNQLGMASSQSDEIVYNNIKELYLNGGGIATWEALSSISQVFPHVENLVMRDNPIEQFTDDSAVLAATFTKMKSLNIGSTGINTWSAVQQLNHFPVLTDIRMQGLPFLEAYVEKLRRQLTIGYLPNIIRLNGSRLDETEREQAERAFIRHYMDSEDPPQRYQELEATHGKLDHLVDLDFKPQNIVTVEVIHDEKSVLHQVNVQWTLSDFKKYIAPHLKIRPKQQNLSHHDMTINFGCEYSSCRMIYPTRTLLRYNVKDGDRIYVDEK